MGHQRSVCALACVRYYVVVALDGMSRPTRPIVALINNRIVVPSQLRMFSAAVTKKSCVCWLALVVFGRFGQREDVEKTGRVSCSVFPCTHESVVCVSPYIYIYTECCCRLGACAVGVVVSSCARVACRACVLFVSVKLYSPSPPWLCAVCPS